MRTALRILAIAYVAYLVITLLVITPLLNFVPGWYVDRTWARELETRWVILNPFKLSLDIASAELDDPDGQPFVALADSSINLSLESLWHAGFVLDELRVHDFFVRLVRLSETEFNFSDLVPPATEEPPGEEPGTPPGVTVHLLDFQARAINLQDRSRARPLETEWTDLDLEVQGLSTVLEEGDPYTLTLRGPGGGELRWEGTVSIPERRSEGQFDVTGLSLPNAWHLGEPWLDFEVRDGRLDVAARYVVSWGEPLHYALREGSFAIRGLDVHPRATDTLPDTSLALSSLRIDGIAVDGTEQVAEVGEVAVEGLAVSGWVEGSRLSVAEMFTGQQAEAGAAAEAPPQPGTGNAPGGATERDTTAATEVAAPEPEPEEETTDWRATLDRFAISNSSVRMRSAFTDPAQVEIAPIEATIEGLAWPFAGESPFTLSLRINDEADLRLEGDLALAAGAGTVAFELQQLALPWFNPNLPAALKARIDRGALALNGSVTLEAFAPVTVALDGAVTDMGLRLEDAQIDEEVFTGWDAVRVTNLAVNLPQRSVVLEKVGIDGFTGRLHIMKDGTINASQLLSEEMGQAEESAGDSEETDAPEASAGDSEEADAAEEPAEGAAAAPPAQAADAAAAGQTEGPGADAAEEPPWSFDISQVILTDSAVDFMDQSLPIQFRTVVEELHGDVTNITSEPGASAKVDIQGSVDGYAPVKLAGTVSPFAEPIALDLDLSFTGVDMALLSPYAGTYAGYRIDSGVMDLNLEYSLEENKLKGDNRIRLGQLKLGEKVDSEKAIDAPIQLAIDILTDSNGVIDMQVPVSGDVDNPSFELGSVIRKAVVGAITGVVTAPFKFLAGLVGSEEDLHSVTFSSGSAELNEAAVDKLATLAEALRQRPKLTISVTGRVNPDADRARLQRNQVNARLLEAGLSQEALDAKGEAWAEAIEAQFDRLPVAAEIDDEYMTIQDKRLLVAHSIAVSDEALLALARERAVAVKTWLVNAGGIAADRAVIKQPNLEPGENRVSAVELGVD